MTPDEVKDLLLARDAARASKDYARADELRAQIERAGFDVVDTPEGARAEPKAAPPTFVTVDPKDIPNTLAEAATARLSLHLLYEGFRSDVERFLAGARAHNDLDGVEIVIVDNASTEGEWLASLADENVRVLHLRTEQGWAAARNAGLKTSAGAIVALVDLSIEPTGDIVTPLLGAFDDPEVGLAGPFGLGSEDMRNWHRDEGPDVAALEGYLLAARRELLAQGLIHEKFRWYRNADIDLSFQLRAMGFRARVVPLPVRTHAHRGWEAIEPIERAKRSKRNHYIFFDRWKESGLGPS